MRSTGLFTLFEVGPTNELNPHLTWSVPQRTLPDYHRPASVCEGLQIFLSKFIGRVTVMAADYQRERAIFQNILFVLLGQTFQISEHAVF